MENKRKNKYDKYQCPCCGYYTFDESEYNTFDICSVCFWEDDGIQTNDIDYEGGANVISLRLARENFKKIGVSDPLFIKHIRLPESNEYSDDSSLDILTTK